MPTYRLLVGQWWPSNTFSKKHKIASSLQLAEPWYFKVTNSAKKFRNSYNFSQITFLIEIISVSRIKNISWQILDNFDGLVGWVFNVLIHSSIQKFMYDYIHIIWGEKIYAQKRSIENKTIHIALPLHDSWGSLLLWQFLPQSDPGFPFCPQMH